MRTRAQRGLQRHSALRGVNPWLLTSQVDFRHCVRLAAAVGGSPSRSVLPGGRRGRRRTPEIPLTWDYRCSARSVGRGGQVRRGPWTAVMSAREPRVTHQQGPGGGLVTRGERSPTPTHGGRAHHGHERHKAAFRREGRPEIRSLSAGSAPGVVSITGPTGPPPHGSATSGGPSWWRSVVDDGSAAVRTGATDGPESVTTSRGRHPGRRLGRHPRVSRHRSPAGLSGVRAGPPSTARPSWNGHP